MAGRSQEEIELLKRSAAEFAVDFVKPGMVVGLGHGSTASWAVRKIAERYESGKLDGILGVPCSKEVEQLAHSLGIPLLTPYDGTPIDVTIDGADEATENLDLIKGGGGALLHEKIVAQASKQEIIVVDDSKLSSILGTTHSLPIEVIRFGVKSQVSFLESLKAKVALRKDSGGIFLTDEGNWILDFDFGPIKNPQDLAAVLKSRAGIVEHGLFLGLAHMLVIAGPKGIRVINK